MDKDSFAAREAGQSIQIARPGTITTQIRTSIWNLVHDQLLCFLRPQGHCVEIRRYLHDSVDDVPDLDYDCILELKLRYTRTKAPWYETYDLFEFHAFRYVFPATPGNEERRKQLTGIFNAELARAGSAYRFLDGQLTPIIDSAEAEEVSRAANLPEKFHGAQVHVQAGLASLAKRPEPEVRNCIEESLHAVESAFKVATGVDGSGLAKSVKAFANEHGVHGALRDAISGLYGYASDKQGLRHPLLDQRNDLTPADARMMIVMASSIVNWVVAKASGLST